MEIEKKYLLSEAQLAKLVGDNPVYELETRYYLYLVLDGETEIRVTRREGVSGARYMLDRMELAGDQSKFISRRKDRIQITVAEFDVLVALVAGQEPVVRKHLQPGDSLEIKVYQGRHKGLIRAEIELPNESDFDTYMPYFEYLADITATTLGRDVLLAKLSKEEFAAELNTLAKR